MTKYLVFTQEQFEAGLAELATISSHGDFVARREIGDPVAVLDALPAAPSAPQPDRADLIEAADALDARAPTSCPYIVTGDEGTSHCSLAESRPTPVERPQPDEVSPDA